MEGQTYVWVGTLLFQLLILGVVYAFRKAIGGWIGSHFSVDLEGVKHEFQVELEKFKQDFEAGLFSREQKDKFRLACIDERLKAHQEAYGLSVDMVVEAGSGNEERIKNLRDSYWNLFKTRALYLSAEARTALNRGFRSFDEYNRLNRLPPEKLGSHQADRMQQCYEELGSTPGEIMKATESQMKPDEAVIFPEKPEKS